MEKPFDVCILGASGFTGKFVLRTWLQVASAEGKGSLRLAIAGRSRNRLEDVLQWANVNETEVPIIIADVYQKETLDYLCSQTRLVLNCTGPFRFYGEPVVRACVESGVDYLDICGEPEFMERMEHIFHETAVQRNSLIVSSCGFDCIPAEMGVLHAAKQFPPPGAPSSVESFLSFKAIHGLKVNFGTWESLVEGIGSAKNLRKLRASKPKQPPLPVPGSPPKRRNSTYFDPRVQAFALPFPGADASVVRRTQQAISKDISEGKEPKSPPVHFAAYFTIKSRWHLLLTSIFGGVSTFIAKFSWGRKLLLQFPGLFSHGIFTKKGPEMKHIEGTSTNFLLYTKGFTDLNKSNSNIGKPDKLVITKVHTPEPGYAATSIIIVSCALTLISERENLPKGGVLTPGYVFASTDLESVLNRHGVTFSVIKEEII